MGLKTTNYEVKALGITLPEAYAIIRNIRCDGERANVTFAIQSTRAAALEKKPIETKMVSFVWDRSRDIAEQAYEAAKSKRTETVKDTFLGKTEEKTVYGCLYGWQDDIVTGGE